jgi:hypothetical protein
VTFLPYRITAKMQHRTTWQNSGSQDDKLSQVRRDVAVSLGATKLSQWSLDWPMIALGDQSHIGG